MRTLALIAITAVRIFTPVSATAATLVANGGFENGDLSDWRVFGTDSDSSFYGIYYGVDTKDANTGTYGAFFGPVGGIMTLSQPLATTAGTQYAISFGLRQDTDPTIGYVNSLSVQLGTITAYSAINIPAQEYATYTVYAQALSPASPLALTFRNDAGFFSLDDVSVSAGIPEPAMLPFLAFVLVAGFVLRSIYGSTKR